MTSLPLEGMALLLVVVVVFVADGATALPLGTMAPVTVLLMVLLLVVGEAIRAREGLAVGLRLLDPPLRLLLLLLPLLMLAEK